MSQESINISLLGNGFLEQDNETVLNKDLDESDFEDFLGKI